MSEKTDPEFELIKGGKEKVEMIMSIVDYAIYHRAKDRKEMKCSKDL